jgi:prevent-host-death family protein
MMPDLEGQVDTNGHCATLKHMADVGIRALKQNASAVVAEAAAGATVTITDRGRPVAQLTPLPTTRLQQLLDMGRARPARRRIDTLASPAAGPSLTTELAAMREAERD